MNAPIDYGKKRSLKEIVGFYCVHVFFILIAGGIIGGVSALLVGKGDDFLFGRRIGEVVAGLFSVFVSMVILYKKHMIKNPLYILLIALAGIVTYVGGVLIGFVVPTYFATLQTATMDRHVFGEKE
ncbi:MAG TPA: hypothetical protein VJH96_00650 [Patescibacteria group bacterium]|nr:hypothetical protein [Patescibacteria group bacterium]